MRLHTVNQLSPLQFVETFGDVYEHSPNIAHETHKQRPFHTLEDLHQAFVLTVSHHPPTGQLELIRAHPDLAGKLASAGKLTKASTKEQKSAGLDFLTDEERETFDELNETYKATFHFPFVICAKEHNKAQILKALEKRLKNDALHEQREAIKQINRIAWHRLNDIIEKESPHHGWKN